MSEVRVGDRVRLESRKLGQVVRDGVVTDVVGQLLRVQWSSGQESTFTPGPGSITVVGRTEVQASKPAARKKTAGQGGRRAEDAALTAIARTPTSRFPGLTTEPSAACGRTDVVGPVRFVQRDVATGVTPPRPRNRQRHGLWTWTMVVVLRRPERVACTKCGASHPAIYNGQQCLVCGSTIYAAARRGRGSGAMILKKHRQRKVTKQYEARIAALQAEREELRAVLGAASNRQRVAGVSDYEWHVELAAKGLAQRDRYPMPSSVTTPEGFYEVMAGAALDATGLRDLLARVARAERNIEVIQDALRQADAKAENACHRAMTDETASSEPSISWFA